MSMHPSGVLILEYVKNGKNSYLSIVTCYTRQRGVDGDRVGSYSSRFQVKPSLVQPINVSNLQANGQQNTVQEIAATETIAVTNDSA